MWTGLIALALGGALGWVRAGRRGGNNADRVQFALAHGIPAGLLAFALHTLALNMGWF